MKGISTPEAIAIISAVVILGIIAAFVYKKFKKSDKASKLAHIIEQIKSTRSNKKHVATGIAVISLLILGCAFTAFLLNASATNTDGNLTVNVSDEEFTIEVADEPVFAVFPVEVTIEEATYRRLRHRLEWFLPTSRLPIWQYTTERWRSKSFKCLALLPKQHYLFRNRMG